MERKYKHHYDRRSTSRSRNRRSRSRSRRRNGYSKDKYRRDRSRSTHDRYYRRNSSYKKQHKYRNRSRDRSYERSKYHYKSKSYSSRSSYSNSYSGRSSSQSPEYPHYRFKIGEYLGRKYRVRALLGDGTFGRVVQAECDNRIYAIKIIKAVQRYIESAKTERSIIRYINSKDPEDKEGIVRFVDSFYHYNSYCMVFKPLGKSLYDVLKMNKYKGFPISLIQSFFRQILRSVGFMHRIGYTHTDLKPQNILLEQNRFSKHTHPSPDVKEILLPDNDRVRIIDFGGATEKNEHHSKIINTRQYRSPEVILGCCQWDHLSDLWSIGCIIIELFTGELYFETHEDVQHLKMIEKHGGQYPQWMLDRATEYRAIFDQAGRVDWPRVASGNSSCQRVTRMKTVRQIFADHAEIRDLLERCLEINPKRRINCDEALAHRFFSVVY